MATKLVNLKDGSDILVPQVFPTEDRFNNVLNVDCPRQQNKDYTLSADCYCHFSGQFWAIAINGTYLFNGTPMNFTETLGFKKGTKITTHGDASGGQPHITGRAVKY